MTRRIIIALCLLATIASGGLAYAASEADTRNSLCLFAVRQGFMTYAEQGKMTDILIESSGTHKISDRDLLFAKHVMDTSPPINTSEKRDMRKFKVLINLSELRDVSPKQLELLDTMIVPQLKSKDPYLQMMSCRILAGIGATEALKEIVPLTHDPNPQVAEDAVRAVSRLSAK